MITYLQFSHAMSINFYSASYCNLEKQNDIRSNEVQHFNYIKQKIWSVVYHCHYIAHHHLKNTKPSLQNQ